MQPVRRYQTENLRIRDMSHGARRFKAANPRVRPSPRLDDEPAEIGREQAWEEDIPPDGRWFRLLPFLEATSALAVLAIAQASGSLDPGNARVQFVMLQGFARIFSAPRGTDFTAKMVQLDISNHLRLQLFTATPSQGLAATRRSSFSCLTIRIQNCR
jgi:hypothetical protein